MRFLTLAIASLSAWVSVVEALTISQINGIKFLSDYNGQAVTGVQGLVTAKGSAGFYIRSTDLSTDLRASNSIYVYGSSALNNVTVGDIITLDAKVSEYRSSINYLYLTELISATNIIVISQGNAVKPIVLGDKVISGPPTEQYSALDDGDVFGVPSNESTVSAENPTLQPQLYGLDFWESLSGELITIKSPTAVSKPNTYGDTWIVGSWEITGRNERRGVTMTDKDANPEAIIVGTPLDGTNNPETTLLGDSLADITGIVQQVFGYYYILPLTNLTILASQQPETPPITKLISNNKCDQLTFSSYNVENLTPKVQHLPDIANHIATYLQTPNLVFLQEIADDDGSTDNGIVGANLTLTTLINSIAAQSNVTYAYAEVDPVNDVDGGATGYNIRQAYLYNPLVLRLRNPNPGNSTTSNVVLPGPELEYNPGRISPLDPAFTDSRKPLTAAWETLDGKNKFFTVNVHAGSKFGGTGIQGDERPPINGGIEDRVAQATVTADFIAQILAEDPNAKVIVGGDFNEFSFVTPQEIFLAISGMKDLEDVAGIPMVERYTYLYEMNCQQLDHIYISSSMTTDAKIEHIHVNTWATSAGQISDHDPSVAKLNVCE
ncbi:Endonuclease/exonuclease/phosphatase [Calycina marina]|uniref:Endonuclease/exonuclease/phosphatase n=1 Tax=Calycina marina TaxID=1763456 RepID=A0A9P7Z8Z8_9HELO|nr:Endonuclease/exonuclease/phosphatase [Calycina marina]